MASQRCARCNSRAINPHIHGRDEGVDLDLCDVCYWRKRGEMVEDNLLKNAIIVAATAYCTAIDNEEKPTTEQKYLAYTINQHLLRDQVERSVMYVEDRLRQFLKNDSQWARAFRADMGLD